MSYQVGGAGGRACCLFWSRAALITSPPHREPDHTCLGVSAWRHLTDQRCHFPDYPEHNLVLGVTASVGWSLFSLMSLFGRVASQGPALGLEPPTFPLSH